MGDGLDLGDRGRAHQHRRLGPTGRDGLGHVADPVLVRQLVRGERVAGLLEPDGVELDVGPERAGLRAQQEGAGGVDQAEGAGGHEPIDRVGPERVGGLDVEVLAEEHGRLGTVGEPGEQPVDRLHRELVLDQLDDVAEGAVRLGPGPVAHAALVAVLQGGLVAVVAVGDDDRLVEHGGGDPAVDVAVGTRPHGVRDAVGIGPLGVGLGVGGQQVGEALGERETPDGRQVGATRTEHVEPVGLGLRCGALVGQDLAGARGPQLEGAEHAGRAAGASGLVDEGHAVDGEHRRLVESEGAVVLPLVEEAAGDVVAVLAVLVDGQVDADRVALVPRRDLGALPLVQHVVGRCSDLAGGQGRVEAEGAEGLEARHDAIVSQPRRGSCQDAAMPWVLDLDGVIRLGSEPVPGAAEAVARLRAAGEEVVFATNNAYRTIADQEADLAAIGIPAAGAVVGSAQAGASLLDPGERVLVVGGPGLLHEVRARGCEVVDDGPCDAVISGLDRAFDYERLRRAGLAIRAGARWILTNPDTTFPTPHGLEPGAGSIGAAIRAAGGVEPRIGGKPEGAMVDLLRDRLGPEGIVVGDRADTDGRFAVALGYRFSLVLTGVTSAADLPVEPQPWRVDADLLAVVTAVVG